MGQNEISNTTDSTVQEFDFTGTHDENELAAIVEDLSSEEAAAALAAIRDVREEQADRKVQNFKNWFDAAFLPICFFPFISQTYSPLFPCFSVRFFLLYRKQAIFPASCFFLLFLKQAECVFLLFPKQASFMSVSFFLLYPKQAY